MLKSLNYNMSKMEKGYLNVQRKMAVDAVVKRLMVRTNTDILIPHEVPLQPCVTLLL